MARRHGFRPGKRTLFINKNKDEEAKDLLKSHQDRIEENHRSKLENKAMKVLVEREENEKLVEQNLELEDIQKEIKQAKIAQVINDIDKVKEERDITK